MDLYAYLTKHDGKPRPDGDECIRLARAARRSPYYLYLAALKHKQFGPDAALSLHEHSIDRELSPEAVNPSVEWHRADDGTRYYRKTS
jgi:hypothetical protein